MSRLDAIRLASRPKMHGRALISGPSGAGKTWTSLSMAQVLTDGDMSQVLMIDTERESALTYADVFPGFAHLPWRPPFDPTELCETLDSLDDQYGVIIADSLSHFWRSQGGTLDIADGKIGGWKTARPVQERLVQSLLAVPAHLLLCVRSKMEYLIEGGRSNQTVTKLGMAPIQDDTLVYEVNIALDIDLEHRITVTKSRTPAVPVGRMYPAGLERKAAEDYAGWLAGGVPPAARDEVDDIVNMFGDFTDADDRKTAKAMFVELFGMPHSLTADVVVEARVWLAEQLEARNAAVTPPAVAPEPEPTALAEAPSVAGPPEPDVPIDARRLGIRAPKVFEQRIDAYPERRKTWLNDSLRHSLAYVVSKGEATSANDLDPEQLLAVWQLLDAIEAGTVTFTWSALPTKGVEWTWADGTTSTVLWTELTLAEAGAA